MATQRPGLKANGSLCASVMPLMPIVCSLMSISSQDRLPPAPANLPPICLESRHRGTSKVSPSSIQVATPRKSCWRNQRRANSFELRRMALQRDGRFHAAVTDTRPASLPCLPLSHEKPNGRQRAWRLKSDRPSYAHARIRCRMSVVTRRQMASTAGFTRQRRFPG